MSDDDDDDDAEEDTVKYAKQVINLDPGTTRAGGV